MSNVDSGSWKQLAEQKEKEWRDVLESRIEALDRELEEKDKELFDEKSKFHELKEHFKYNLKLIQERDRELEKYDIASQEIRTKLNSKNAEISELKIRIDDLKNVITREEKAKDELQSNYQWRLREKQAEVDAYKSSKDNEVKGEREEYEKFRRDLHRQLASVQGELETQKRELTTEFESALKKREHEFKLQKDELEAKAFERDLKVKLLEKELELGRDSNQKTLAMAQEAETSHRDLKKMLKQKEWELADTMAVKDAQISELEKQLAGSESTIKKLHEDFQRKYTELDRSVREREDKLERARSGYLEKEQELLSANQALQSRLEDGQVRERQVSWAHQDTLKEKDLRIDRLQEELQDVRERWDRHVSEISRSTVERDMELGTAREEQQRLKEELQQRKADLERYKKELKAAAEREEKLDRAKVQAQLDWQRRCDTLETQQYNSAEDLIEKLTKARDEAQALVRERERELKHKTLLVKSFHQERDQLRAVLKNHSIPLDSFVKYSIDWDAAEEEMNYVENLEKQNSELKELVAQMRSEMESLAPENLKPDTDKSKLEAARADNSSLYEEDIQDLRKQNRELREKLSSARISQGRPPLQQVDPDGEKQVMAEVEGNSVVKNHILALNGTIGSLRSEKVELAATVKKQQVKIAYLENSLEEVSKQPRQKQIQIDQLSYELSSLRQRAETEQAGLQRRVKELELQLGEARREADEYHRAGLESNQELVALGNQLAALKMEQSGSNATINFGAQELYIQQLQTELSQLRKRAAALDPSMDKNLAALLAESSSSSDTARQGGGDKAELQYKLRSAAAKIVQLAKEVQQLTESNNRLRVELKAALDASQSSPSSKQEPRPHRDKFSSLEDNKDKEDEYGQNLATERDQMYGRLSQLEKLQYQLTRQELQFARRFKAGSKGEEKAGGRKDLSESDSIPEKDYSGLNKRSNNPRTQSSSQGKTTPSPPPTSQRHPVQQQQTRERVDPHMLMSISSGGGDSIQQVWQMLNESMTSYNPSEKKVTQSPRSQTDASRIPIGDGGDERSFMLKGQSRGSQDQQQQQQRRSAREVAMNYAQKVRRPAQSAKPKIRNYNIRDDRSGAR